MRLFLLLIFITSSLLSCQTVTVQHGPVTMQYGNLPASISPGLKLKLHKEIVIPGGSASLHIQDGEPRPQQLNPVENYRPYCIIEVKVRRPSTQVISPGIFKITRVVLDEEVVSLIPKLASLADKHARNRNDSPGLYLGSGGHTAVTYATEMYLASETQPEVTRLICQQWDDPATGDHLTVEEIARALGQLITIETEFPNQ